jgi:hypothetical protein
VARLSDKDETMTSRERIEAALNHRTPDRTPVFEYVLLSPLADAFLGRRYAADPANWEALLADVGWEAAVRRQALDSLDLALVLGHDMLYVVPNPCPPAPASPPAPGPLVQPADDPVERVAQRLRERETWTVRPEQFRVYELLAEEQARRGLDLPVLAPAYVHGVWTDTDLMETMVLAPEVARQHFQWATGWALRMIDGYLARGIRQIGVGGDFSGTRPLISPAAYREFIVPEVRAVSRRIHAAGGFAVNASDGNLWPVIDDFLLGTEVDGYLEVDWHAGMDLRRLKETHGGRIAFYGNLDCGNILSFATPEKVGRHTWECLEAGWGDGGHILCASNAITASVPMGNYLAVINAYRDMFGIERFRLPA